VTKLSTSDEDPNVLDMFVPRPHLWTGEEYDSLPEDNVRRELVDGVLVVSPYPNNDHQTLAAELTVALRRQAPRHLYRVTQNVEVKLNDKVRFVPDVVVMHAEAYTRRRSRFDVHDVMIAVEIESPSSRSFDRVLKPSHFGAAGVPYYWRIEMDDEPTLFVYENTGNAYRVMGTFTDKVELEAPFPVAFDLRELAD